MAGRRNARFSHRVRRGAPCLVSRFNVERIIQASYPNAKSLLSIFSCVSTARITGLSRIWSAAAAPTQPDCYKQAGHSRFACLPGNRIIAAGPDFFQFPVKFADVNFVISPFHHVNFADFRAGEIAAFCPGKFYGRNANVIAFNIPAVPGNGLFFDRAFAGEFGGRTGFLCAAGDLVVLPGLQ